MSKVKQVLKEYLKYYEDVQKIATESKEIKNRILFIKEAISELKTQEANSCEWHYKKFDNSWNGTCGAKWWLEEIPSACDMNFCPKCGGKLIEKEF